VAVVGAPDPLYEERVTAFVRLTDPAQPFDEAELRAYVRERLAGFKVPRAVHVIDELPRTGVGKVSKPQLRERLARESA
jgi:fatty-acyl-CoA synthase